MRIRFLPNIGNPAEIVDQGRKALRGQPGSFPVRPLIVPIDTDGDELDAAEDAFEVVALRNDREHYDRTLRMWERTLAAREAEAIALVGADAVAHFHRYLKISAMGFRTGAICLLRMSFVRR